MRKFLLLCAFSLLFSGVAFGGNIYISQGGSGSGTSCSSPLPDSWFQDTANWGNAGGQIGPGTTVHLCGTFSYGAGQSGLTVRADRQGGTSGNPITILFEPGAAITSPAFSVGLTVAGGSNWLVVDGGSNGTIQNTSNGSGLSYNQDSKGIDASNCNNCEFKNLHVQNIYVHSPATDDPQNGSGIWVWGDGVKIHDNVCKNSGKCFEVVGNYAGSSSYIGIYNNDVSEAGWGIACAVYGGRTLTNLSVYNNHWHDYTNWDSPSDAIHKNFIAHCYSTGTPLGKIQNAYIYNNLVDGNLGRADETTADIFLESSDTPWTDSTGTAYIFNNVFSGTFSDGIGPANGLVAVGTGSGHMILNNTFLGQNRADGDIINMNPCCGAPPSTNVRIQNNVVETGDHLLYLGPGTTVTSIDYNTYANSRDFMKIGTVEYLSFTAWKAVCGCDSHSTAAQSSPLASLSSSGVPSGSFAGAGTGTNLSSIATGPLAALSSDRRGTPRPGGSSAWDAGAYTLGTGTISQSPLPPSSLTATVR